MREEIGYIPPARFPNPVHGIGVFYHDGNELYPVQEYNYGDSGIVEGIIPNPTGEIGPEVPRYYIKSEVGRDVPSYFTSFSSLSTEWQQILRKWGDKRRNKSWNDNLYPDRNWQPYQYFWDLRHIHGDKFEVMGFIHRYLDSTNYFVVVRLGKDEGKVRGNQGWIVFRNVDENTLSLFNS